MTSRGSTSENAASVYYLSPLRFFADLRRDPLEFLMDAAQLGDLVQLRFPFFVAYFAVDPRCVKRVLQDNSTNYGHETRFNSIYRNAIGDGLLTSEGEPWRRTRRLARNSLRRECMEGLASIVVESTNSMLERWRTAARNGESIELESEFTRLTLKIAAKSFCGVDLGNTSTTLADAMFEAFDYLNFRIFHLINVPQAIPTARNRRFQKAARAIRSIVGSVVEEASRVTETEGNLLASLIRLETETDDCRINHVRALDEVVAILGAGSATTSAALVWIYKLLSESPAVERKLRTEAQEICSGHASSAADLARLEYVRMVILETLRLFPPSWAMSAQAIAGDELAGTEIPAGARVLVSPYVTHRLARYWESPEKFRPERFSSEESTQHLSYAFFPFGGGHRKCIGEEFAMLQMSLIVSMIAKSFRLRPIPGHSVAPRVAFTLRTANGLRAKIEES